MLGCSTVIQDTPGFMYCSLGPGRPSFMQKKNFLMLTGYTCTFYHAPSHAPSNQNQCTIHLHAMQFQQPSLMPRLFFWNETTIHLPFIYIYMPTLTLQCNTYMLDLSFSIYYDVAKLQIVYVENKYNPIA